MLAVKKCLFSIPARCISSSAARFGLVNLSVDDKTGIATLEMNRPPVNGLNTPLLQEISTALTNVGKNKSKGLILTTVSELDKFIMNTTVTDRDPITVITKSVFGWFRSQRNVQTGSRKV